MKSEIIYKVTEEEEEKKREDHNEDDDDNEKEEEEVVGGDKYQPVAFAKQCKSPGLNSIVT